MLGQSLYNSSRVPSNDSGASLILNNIPISRELSNTAVDRTTVCQRNHGRRKPVC
jgi:hypothetical protein